MTVSSIEPELWVDRASAAVDFYEAAFGATTLLRVGDGDDIVARLAIGEARFWVGAAGAELHRFSPETIGGRTSRTLLVVDDPDAVVARAVSAGATESRAGGGRTRLAGGPDHRPVRARVGDRHPHLTISGAR